MHPLLVDLSQMNPIEKGGIILPAVYLVRPIRLHVCTAAKRDIHHPNAVVFQIANHERLFSVEISGVLYA